MNSREWYALAETVATEDHQIVALEAAASQYANQARVAAHTSITSSARTGIPVSAQGLNSLAELERLEEMRSKSADSTRRQRRSLR